MALTEITRKLGTFGPFKCEMISFNKSAVDTTETFTTNIRQVKGISTGVSAAAFKVFHATAADSDVVTVTLTFSSSAARRVTVFIIGY